MLSVAGIDVFYGNLRVVKEVTFEVKTNRTVTILGVNGAGKTTIINTISGFLKPAKGAIKYNDRMIQSLKPYQIVKSGIVQISQNRDLFPELNVRDNLELGAVIEKDDNKISNAFEEVFKHFPRLEERQNQRAGSLSGGEQQMLAIARALMSGPELLMMDEPCAGLAPILVKEIMGIIEGLKKSNKTILLVETRAHLALSIANYYYVLQNGEIVAQGDTTDLPEEKEEFLRNLIKAVTFK